MGNSGTYSPTASGVSLLNSIGVSSLSLFPFIGCAVPPTVNFIPTQDTFAPKNEIQSNHSPVGSIQATIPSIPSIPSSALVTVAIPNPVSTAFLAVLIGDVFITLPTNLMLMSNATKYWSPSTVIQANGFKQSGFISPADGSFWTSSSTSSIQTAITPVYSYPPSATTVFRLLLL